MYSSFLPFSVIKTTPSFSFLSFFKVNNLSISYILYFLCTNITYLESCINGISQTFIFFISFQFSSFVNQDKTSLSLRTQI